MTTPQEILSAAMVEKWGKVNVTRLARESGVARESVSKILNYSRGIGPEVAAKLAAPLDLDPATLIPPAEERVTLALLLRRLDEERDQAEKGRRGLARSLAAIHADLRRIEARLPAEAPSSQEAQT